MCQELLNDRILNFEPDYDAKPKFVVFILFCKVTSGGNKFWVVPKSYIILCNGDSRFELYNFTTF